MHIDFAPPSNGTYNNAGSSRKLTNYLEHEDLERMEKGIYTEGFFNLMEDNIYKSKVIKDIDTNIGQLLKTDAKFYAIHVSPSEKELRAMGNTEQKQPNERVCTVMEAGSSFGEIDNILIYRLLKINRCKNRCHLFPRKIAKFHFGGQSGDKNIRLNLVVKSFICNFVYRPSQC